MNLNETHSALVSEWSERNIEKPDRFKSGSNKKVWWKCRLGHEWQAEIRERVRGTGCPYCSNRKVLLNYNDLATTHPKLTLEWSPKNILLPSQISSGSNKKVWWECRLGHEWQTVIRDRVRKQTKCPYCKNSRPLKKFNDLQTINPALASEWNNKNKTTPDMILPYSNKKVWWKCSKGHEWQTTPLARMQGTNCPYCSGRLPIAGETDLVTTHPEIAAEWSPKNTKKPEEITAHYNKKICWECNSGHQWKSTIKQKESQLCPQCHPKKQQKKHNILATNQKLVKQWNSKNINLPTEYTSGSSKKVWWKCSKGHEWQSRISDRTLKQTGCPTCAKTSSKSEKILAEKLAQLNTEWIVEHNPPPIHGHYPDIKITTPKHQIIIELDGQYWHSQPQSYQKDVKQTEAYIKAKTKVIRIRNKKLKPIPNTINIKHEYVIRHQNKNQWIPEITSKIQKNIRNL